MGSAIVVGAGVVGCSVALALAKRGFAVTVLERSAARFEAPGETGAASWAAAGILGAQIATREDGPLARLCAASRAMYPAFAREVEALAGAEVELRPSGLLRPAFSAEELDGFVAERAWQERAGLRVEVLDAKAARAIEPELGPGLAGAVRFPDEARVDPPKLLAALRDAVERSGATLRFASATRRVRVHHGRAVGVELEGGDVIEADLTVLAAGSWSSSVEDAVPLELEVLPARGQMIELHAHAGLVRGPIEHPVAYLSPRDDGRVLVGSTVELAGFQKGARAGAVASLLAGAVRLVPALGGAAVVRTWAGFRPFVRDELPLIGRAPGVDGLVLATGHHRNGVLLAPITAAMIAALVTGEASPFDAAPFSCARASS